MKRSEKPVNRCGDKAAIARMFMNGIRGVLGQEELYPDSPRSDEERFYVTPMRPYQDGRIPPRRPTL